MHEKSPALAGLFHSMLTLELGFAPYLDDFFALEREEVDLRAVDFEAFFAPDLEVDREVDFLAPDLVPERDDDFEDFLVAGDFAICGCPFVPLK
jgi:hypothetical protein